MGQVSDSRLKKNCIEQPRILWCCHGDTAISQSSELSEGVSGELGVMVSAAG